jgi:hypothetical protein
VRVKAQPKRSGVVRVLEARSIVPQSGIGSQAAPSEGEGTLLPSRPIIWISILLVSGALALVGVNLTRFPPKVDWLMHDPLAVVHGNAAVE